MTIYGKSANLGVDTVYHIKTIIVLNTRLNMVVFWSPRVIKWSYDGRRVSYTCFVMVVFCSAQVLNWS